jgi:hypothetical protein
MHVYRRRQSTYKEQDANGHFIQQPELPRKQRQANQLTDKIPSLPLNPSMDSFTSSFSIAAVLSEREITRELSTPIDADSGGGTGTGAGTIGQAPNCIVA